MLHSGSRGGWRIHRLCLSPSTSSFALAHLASPSSWSTFRFLRDASSGNLSRAAGCALKTPTRWCHSGVPSKDGVPSSSTCASPLSSTDAAARQNSAAADAAAEGSTALSTAADSPSFLSALLEPEETIPLVDTTRTYATMDVVERCEVYNPLDPNVTDDEDAPAEGPLQRAHAAGRLWDHFAGTTKSTGAASLASSSAASSSPAEPPQWFVQLCKDLYYRTDSSEPSQRNADAMDETARESDPLTQRSVEAAQLSKNWRGMPSEDSAEVLASSVHRADEAMAVDPYTWLPFDLLDVKDYGVGPYVFPSTATYTTEQRVKLCLGHRQKEYVHFCNTYCFPQRWQIPTSMGTQPARLLVDPSCPTPVVFLQLSPDFPPAMWLPIRASVSAIRGVLSSFATHAFFHREEQHAVFEQRYQTSKRVMELQQLPTSNEGDVLRFMAYEARNTPYLDAPLREYPNQQEFFLGEYDDPEKLLEQLDLCPFLFAMPHLRTVTDPHAERMIPTVEGAGVVPSLFRCIFSKALIQVSVHLSAEVKLPPQDPEGFHFLWKDSQVVPKMKIPVFARVSWPDNTHLSGGGLLARRFNKLFQTEFAPDTPVDALLSLFYVAQWAQRVHDFLGVAGMRQRVAELEAAAHVPEPAKLYPGTREIPNPEYTAQERLGMHIQYLSHLGDPQVLETITAMLPSASAPVRMGCAKAALIAGDRELFRRIVSSEPPGRTQHYMTKLVVKRKTRDLVDPEPRLLEDQYEFAAPLWTKRGTRIDRNTLEGAVDAARLLR